MKFFRFSLWITLLGLLALAAGRSSWGGMVIDTIGTTVKWRIQLGKMPVGAVAIDGSVVPNRVYVSDTGNHRVLGWSDISVLVNGEAPDLIIGQLSSSTTIPNIENGPTAKGLFSPTGLDVDSTGRLYVCDTGNHRVLAFNDPFNTDLQADFVFGQGDVFTTNTLNKTGVNADGLNNPTAVHVVGASTTVFIADQDNHRVLGYTNPTTVDRTADFVYGQSGSFTTNTTYIAAGALATNMNYPCGMAFNSFANDLYVCDGGNASTTLGNRVLVFQNALVDTTTADFVFGQGNVFNTSLANKTGINADGLFHPQGVYVNNAANSDVFIADRGNNRVLLYTNPLGTNRTADKVFGQTLFTTNDPNLGGLASGLNAPQFCDMDSTGALWIVDTGNNRALKYANAVAGDTAPDLVLNQPNLTSTSSGVVDGRFLSSPEDVVVDKSVTPNRVYVADTANHRVLGFKDMSQLGDGAHADIVIGQADFSANSANRGGGIAANTLSSPRGVFVDPLGNLWVADSGNNRVLCFNTPFALDTAADLVLGQPGFVTGVPNNGGISASSLFEPMAVFVDAFKNVFVSDTANHRVLQYNDPAGTNTVADRVFGQGGVFTTNATYLAGGATANNLNFPRGVFAYRLPGSPAATAPQEVLYVCDSGNGVSTLGNRVLIFTDWKADSTADFVLGQGAAGTVFTTSTEATTTTGLNNPKDVWVDGVGTTSRVFVADADNNRVIRFDDPVVGNRTADAVIGQNGSFTTKTSGNSRFTLTHPTGVAIGSDGFTQVLVADRDSLRVVIDTGPWDAVLGISRFDVAIVNEAAADTLNISTAAGVGGIAIDTSVVPNRLFVSDRNNNRVLGWSDIDALANGDPADLVIGQNYSFQTVTANLGGLTSNGRHCLNVPQGLWVDGSGRLYVCDTGNHRVLVFNDPYGTDLTADFVFGQLDVFTTGNANQGGLLATALSSPADVYTLPDSSKVFIADAGNHRVLEYDNPLTVDDTADRVYGQSGAFNTAGTYTAFGGAPPDASAILMNSPTGVFYDSGNDRLYVVEGGNGANNLGNRVLVFATALAETNTADFVFGQDDLMTDSTNNRGGISADSLLFPRHITVNTATQAVYIADRSNNRVLYFDDPITNDRIADKVFGQSLFTTSTANILGLATGLSGPTSLALDGSGNLWVLDGNNNRILKFDNPVAGDTTPDLQLGQPSFAVNFANRVSAATMNSPFNVTIDSTVSPYRVYVADSTNNRVLGWDDILDFRAGNPATLVIGQADFQSAFVNRVLLGATPAANSLSSPRGLAVDASGNLWVADTSNNRVLCFQSPFTTDQTADYVLGQPAFTTNTANLGGVHAASLNGPQNVYVDASGNVFVSDTSNHRVLEYDNPLSNDASADRVYGQGSGASRFTTNATYIAAGGTASNLNFPRGVFYDVTGDKLYVCDSGNATNTLGNRVLVYDNPYDAGVANATTADFVFGQGAAGNVFNVTTNGTTAIKFDNPYDVWVTGSGTSLKVYTLELDDRRVLRFDNPFGSGDFTADEVYGQTSFTGTTSATTVQNLTTPTGFAFSPLGEGDMLIADSTGHRVVMNRSERRPVAVCAPGQTVAEGSPVSLSGVASFDPDGDPITAYQWSQTAGQAVTLTDGTTRAASFTAPNLTGASSLTFLLEVTSATGSQIPVSNDSAADLNDTITINVTASDDAPIADAGTDQTVNENDIVTLDGSGSDDADLDGSLVLYTWSQTGGPAVTLSNVNAVMPTFTAPDRNALPTNQYTLTFQLVVRDNGANDSPADTVIITVNAPNDTPVAYAGPDQARNENNVVILNATGSTDADVNDTLTYTWVQTVGPAVTINNANTATPTFTAPDRNEASYLLTFEVTVDDGDATDTDTVDITVTAGDDTPIANAGPDQNVNEAVLVALNGFGSYDPDVNGVITYDWLQTAGPAVTLSDSAAAAPTFIAPNRNASYALTFRLIVDDGTNMSAADFVTVNVTAVNNTPTANAGTDQNQPELVLVSLNGAASVDADENDTLNYSWAQSGSNPAGIVISLNNAGTATPDFTTPNNLVDYDVMIDLIVDDGVNFSVADTVVVHVFVSNNPPIADAGPDQNVNENDLVTLDGTGSSDPDLAPITYLWSQTGSVPAGIFVTLSDPTDPNPTFTAPNRNGNYTLTFGLRVNDGVLNSSQDTVTINVTAPNDTPVADAGPDDNGVAGAFVELDAGASTDADENDALTYLWTYVGSTPPGVAITLLNEDTATPIFLAPGFTQDYDATFEVEASDGTATDTDTVVIHIVLTNTPPIADAGTDQNMDEGDLVILDGSGSLDPDLDDITYLWTQTGSTPPGIVISLSDPTAELPTFTAPNRTASYSVTFELVVEDSFIASPADSVTINIAAVNDVPIANAGIDQTLNEGLPVQLDGSASVDPDVDGGLASYAWAQTGSVPPGFSVTLDDPSSPTPSFTLPVTSSNVIYTFQLIVNDGVQDSVADEVKVTALDVTGPVILSFTPEDNDHNGRYERIIVIFSEGLQPGNADINDWFILDADGVTNHLQGLTNANLTLVGSVLTFTLPNNRGTLGMPVYRYEDDGFGGALADVNGNMVPLITTNAGPDADAGDDQVSAPTRVFLDASASSDPEDQPIAYAWSQTGGPVAVALNDADTEFPDFLGQTDGIYTFEVMVTDPFGEQNVESVDVTILNVAPSADAGVDFAVQRDAVPSEDVTLSGRFSADANSSDLSDDIATYAWAQLSGPSAVAIVDADTGDPEAEFDTSVLTPGFYEFELTVTDDDAATNTDRVIVLINDVFTNLVPNADAGIDYAALEGFPLLLDGHESRDSDGDTLTFDWTQDSGPAVVISDASASQPLFTPPQPGIYEFSLVVNDGLTDSAPDSVRIVVHDPLNLVPRADAGDDQFAMVGDLVTLDGSGSVDSRQDPLTYQWTQIGGPAALLTGATSEVAEFVPTAVGIYRFQLAVNDGVYDSPVDTVAILVESPAEHAPVADAGNDQIGHVGTPITLDGSNSGDIDLDSITLTWTQIIGPQVQLSDSHDIFPAFTPTESATYVFALVVDDGDLVSLPDFVILVVHGANNVPTAHVSAAFINAFQGKSVTLSASPSTDADHQPLLYFWSQLGGPPVVLNDHTSVSPVFKAPLTGTYLFEVYVDDGADRSPPVLVTVNAEAAPALGGGGGGGGGALDPAMLLGMLLLALVALRRRS